MKGNWMVEWPKEPNQANQANEAKSGQSYSDARVIDIMEFVFEMLNHFHVVVHFDVSDSMPRLV